VVCKDGMTEQESVTLVIMSILWAMKFWIHKKYNKRMINKRGDGYGLPIP